MENTSPHHLLGPSLAGRSRNDRSKQVVGSQTLGAIGEELAYHFLLAKGYKVLLRNYECPIGEIDLIAKERGQLVFIEVKTRSSDEMGAPAEAVTFHKRRQIGKCAQYYLKRYGIHDVPCRFDVLSIVLLPNKEPVFDLIESAFMEGE